MGFSEMVMESIGIADELVMGGKKEKSKIRRGF